LIEIGVDNYFYYLQLCDGLRNFFTYFNKRNSLFLLRVINFFNNLNGKFSFKRGCEFISKIFLKINLYTRLMKTKNLLPIFLLFCLFMFVSCNAFANNITVSNFSLTGHNTSGNYTMVKFDITWNNSWRTSSAPNNWDAAWVFVKYRVAGPGEVWHHALLDNTGHINPSGSTITTGLLNPALPFNTTGNPGLGAFIYRSANGTGTFTNTGVKLRWNYGATGVADNASVEIIVYAVEMVNVPQGSFYVGSGGTEVGAFYKYPATTNPYQITGEGAITVGTTADNLYYPLIGYSGDQLGPIPAAFPKGYNSLYCMKYEISQQEYVDFLNTLTYAQQETRTVDGFQLSPPNSVAGTYLYDINRNKIKIGTSGTTGTVPAIYATDYPYVACNFLNWPDVAAYLDWSGLRPMTELEYEKSCRGPLAPVPDEFAWGTVGIAPSFYTLSNPGANNEIITANYSLTLGNVSYDLTVGSIDGPLRVGIFASNILNTGRVTAGATYYGIMEMSGNLWERSITAGKPEGRGFIGTHGDGTLLNDGNSNVISWPDLTGLGAGFRGGEWLDNATYLRVSDRNNAAYFDEGWSEYYYNYGGRGVRSAPL
jgi:formylglycine-generating enzyme required for sulfatase activity